MFIKTQEEIQKNLFKNGYKEVPDTKIRNDKKTKVRYKIENEVFDIHDSVADNSKMISFLISLLSLMYNAFTDEMKNKLTDKEKNIIESTFELFKTIKTRADIQFELEGEESIKKLLERQAKIGEIISNEYDLKES